jgi:hypothetical protein
MDDRFREKLMVHNWSDHLPDALSIEDLYQMFKARLRAECIAELEGLSGVETRQNPESQR